MIRLLLQGVERRGDARRGFHGPGHGLRGSASGLSRRPDRHVGDRQPEVFPGVVLQGAVAGEKQDLSHQRTANVMRYVTRDKCVSHNVREANT